MAPAQPHVDVFATQNETPTEQFFSKGPRVSLTALTGSAARSPSTKRRQSASHLKQIIELPVGKFCRLVPHQLDQLQGFPKGWTDTGMTDGHRAFCMGNALVTGVPHRIGEAMVEVYGL